MFTGIVEEVGAVASAPAGKLTVGAELVVQGMMLGQSIGVNGVCLTVTRFDSRSFTVDVMAETLRRTNLGALFPGAKVNLERPLAMGGQIGGHLVQGHIDATGNIMSFTPEAGAFLVCIEAPPQVMRYIVKKGFIAVDGISLTVADRESGSFRVSVVQYTREHTTLGFRRSGDAVNLEIDIIAKYVERMIRPAEGGMTREFLQEHGFAP